MIGWSAGELVRMLENKILEYLELTQQKHSPQVQGHVL